MSKTRVYELAIELDISSKDLITILQEEFGIEVKNHMSVVEEDDAELIRELLLEGKYTDFVLQRLVISNIKKFGTMSVFNFSDSLKFNTISGKNGAGKSTIFKCLIFIQKAFFIDLLKNNDKYLELKEELGKELFTYFNENKSYIEVLFKAENRNNIVDRDVTEVACASENNYVTLRLVAEDIINETVKWRIEYSNDDYRIIKVFWNLYNPSNVIIYIDSNKYFIEEDVRYNNINIQSDKKEYSPIIDIILNPQDIFHHLYNRLINDYLQYRLIPPSKNSSNSLGRKDIYYHVTKLLYKYIFPDIRFSNFSGTTLEEQFILLARNYSGKFDIRNFSSGEKLAFYLLLFINYTKNLGILIIDELENHLHEEIMCRFSTLLKEIANSDNYIEYILDMKRKLSYLDKSNILEKNIEVAYSKFRLNQIFLITHSKSLIYQNFLQGSNFVLENNLELLNKDYEQKLRSIGISYTYEKVLFVEGKTDFDLLQNYISDFNIKVKPLGNCLNVINTYKRIVEIKDYIRDSNFAFLIDRDTKEEYDFNRLRQLDSDYFDKSFIFMNKHEIENYLLDSDAIFSAISKCNEKLFKTKNEIDKALYDIATENKFLSMRKYLNYYINLEIDKLKTSMNQKDIKTTTLISKDSYASYITEKILKSEVFANIENQLLKLYDNCSIKYDDDNWESFWRDLCDGKVVLNKFIANNWKKVGLTDWKLKDNIINTIYENKHSDFNKLIEEIVLKFNGSTDIIINNYSSTIIENEEDDE